MKSLINTALAVVLAIPVLSHASEPLTRAQVRAELIQLEDAGYDPVVDKDYPQNLKHAETIVAQQNEANTGYGSDPAGLSQAGSMAQAGRE